MALSAARRAGALLAGTLMTVGLVPATGAAAATPAPAVVAPLYGDAVLTNPVLDWEPAVGAVRYRVQVATNETFSPASAVLYSADTYATRATPTVDLPFGSLFWKVAGIDAANVVGEYTEPVLFTRTSVAAPTPVAPAEGAVLDYPAEPPVLQWLAVPAVKEYEVTVDDNDVFASPEVFKTSSTQLALTEPLTLDKDYFWKVRGLSITTGVTTAESAPRSFRTTWPTVPTALSPLNAQLVDHTELSWSAVPGAAYYELEVSADEHFTNNLTSLDGKTRQKVFGTRFSPTAQLPVTSYYWRVRAVDAGTTPHPSPWSVPVQFTLRPPTRPTDLQVDGAGRTGDVYDPAFSWTGVARASRYEISLSSNGFTTAQTCITMHTTFTPYKVATSPVLTGGTQPACSFTLNPGTAYQWRVRALDDAPAGGTSPASIPGEWSSTASFVYRQDTPFPLAPASGATTSVPVLTWSRAADHGQYEVTVYPSTGTAHVQKTYATTYTPVGTSATGSPVKPGTYSWTVSKVAADGTSGPQPFSFGSYTVEAATPVDGPVTLLGPADGASSVDMPSMTWTPVTGASYYQVFVTEEASSTYRLLSPDKLFLPAFTAYSDVLPAGTYKWYVRAFSSGGAPLALDSDVRTFTVDAPASPVATGTAACSTAAPCATPEHDTPQLSWEESPGASSYQVTLAGDEAFTNKLRVYTTQHKTLTPRDALPDNEAGKSYYWYVQACRDADGCPPADVSKPALDAGRRSFQKSSLPVQQIAPADQAVLTDQVRFTWEDWFTTNANALLRTSSGARSYRLQVASDPLFSTLLEDLKLDQPVHTPWSKAYPDGVYYWRVQAVDGADQGLEWSTVRRFQKVSSSPVPQGSVVTGNLPTLTWEPLAFSGSYMVEVYRDADPAFPPASRVLQTTTKYAALTPKVPLAPGTYSWRVRKLDASGNPGPWSAGTPTFTVAQAAPTLLAPANGATLATNDALFSWSAPDGAAASSYRFESSTSPAFTSRLEEKRTVMTSWAPTAFYADGKTYYWRVHVLDGNGGVLATSAVRTFVKDALAPKVKSNPATGTPVLGPVTVTFDEPVTGLSTSSVKLRVDGTSTNLAGAVTGSGTDTLSFTPKAPLVPGQRYAVLLSSGITDLAGNALVATTARTRTATVVEADSNAVQHLWDRDSNSSASSGAYLSSATKGAALAYTFSGTSVSVVGQVGPDGGTAEYWVDGVKKATASSYSSSASWQKTLFTTSGLSAGTHSLKVVVTGSRPSGSTGSWVHVDAVKVGSTTVQETSLTQRFATVANASASAGAHVLERHTASGDTGSKPEYRFSVRGTSVRLTGTRLPTGGQASVYVDGTLRGTIDTYAASQTNKAALLTVTGLTDTVHAVRVIVRGTRATASKGYDVALDTVGTS